MSRHQIRNQKNHHRPTEILIPVLRIITAAAAVRLKVTIATLHTPIIQVAANTTGINKAIISNPRMATETSGEIMDRLTNSCPVLKTFE